MGCGAKPQPTNDLVCIGVKKSHLVAAVFVIFPKNKCNFLHKSKLDIVQLVQFLTGRRPMRSFSPGAVATIAPWKSADYLQNVVENSPGPVLRSRGLERTSGLSLYFFKEHFKDCGML